ncbi:hypothetical protein PVAND_006381 [Polypedilum vanderplanki]|uniref:Roundabout n=1 Tax=Polypedilum vanderplanki TaxID=319348 RepID=A0A9J6C3S5_POLVA|nr:hypothetical protein PVAND_006381 [Polypedilum vanderplanki]
MIIINEERRKVKCQGLEVRIVDGGNLMIQDARQSDDGRYQCIAKNIVGVRESAIAFLKVHVKPFLIRGPQNQTAITGSSVVFQCRVGGEPLPDVLWRRTASGGNMPLGRVHILEDRSLKIDNITMDDIGEYSCEADNAVGTVVASGMLLVHSPPSFTIRPKSQVGELNGEVIFECQATGYPEPTLFWTIEGNRTLILPGIKSKNIEASLTADGGSILSIDEIDRSDNGKVIVCSAVNSVGSVSTRVVLTVNLQDDTPPPQTFKDLWYKDGIPVAQSDKITIDDNGLLTITELNKNDDTGLYTCVASSKSGKSTWSGFLKLENPTNPNIKFFRAPESSTFPGQPGKPELIEKTDNSVTLSWIRSNAIGASSLLGYSVEMFGRNSTDGWVQIANRIQNTTYKVLGLTSGVSYYFAVRAENSHGMSGPSQLSEPITVGMMDETNTDLDLSEARASLLSGDVVELINATSVDSTSMKLLWEIINGKYVEGFYIYARNIDDAIEGDNHQGSYKMLTILNAGSGGASSCKISGLQKFTTYEFFIVPFYRTVEGKPSNSRIARTLEDVPSEPPSNMEAKLLNVSTVYVKWKAPPTKSHNGILKFYNVIVRGVNIYENISKVLTNITIDASSSSIMLANLTEGVTYTVSVAAINRIGLGPYNQPSILRLDPITKRLDTTFTNRFPLNNEHMSDDFLTQPWFIILLGTILVIMMLSFAIMVFIKRRHMLMKQSAFNGLAGPSAGGAVKIANKPGGNDGYWLDPSGIVWRSNSRSKGSLIPDYAPVCTSTTTTTLPADDEAVRSRFMGEYTDYPADYAEVSSFQSGQQSPAPYATTTLIGSSKFAPNEAHRFNMFYKTDIYPPPSNVGNGSMRQQQTNSNNSNNYNRSIHSESYCNNNKINIVENRMCAGTMMPNMFNQQHSHNGIKIGSNKRNRLKLMKPQNIRNYFSNPNEQLYVKVGEINQVGPHSLSNSSQQSHTPQSQNGSINWSQHNFNLYENQLHNHLNNGATVNNEPDDIQNDDNHHQPKQHANDKNDFIYTGNRSIMSYTSSKDFPENV